MREQFNAWFKQHYGDIDTTHFPVGVAEDAFAAGHAAGLEAAWIPMTNEDRPNENENVWITGIAYKKRFYAEAKWRKGEWLMFDQVADEHCMPCEFPDHWQRIVPPLSEQ